LVSILEKGAIMEKSMKVVASIVGFLLVATLVVSVTNFKFGSPREIIKQRSYVSVDNVDQTLDCLTMNVYREAGREAFEGKVAVAQVTLNRLNNPKFPKDICGVVYQKNIIMEKVVCQFSWHCEGAPNKKPTDDPAYKESYAVAKKVLLEGFRLDSLNDALFFHATHVHPNWAYKKVAQIGNHIFYKEI
jgi:spore germination cell wall hydrolase CwlJ-like protein